jgi:hypothetical protein
MSNIKLNRYESGDLNTLRGLLETLKERASECPELMDYPVAFTCGEELYELDPEVMFCKQDDSEDGSWEIYGCEDINHCKDNLFVFYPMPDWRNRKATEQIIKLFDLEDYKHTNVDFMVNYAKENKEYTKVVCNLGAFEAFKDNTNKLFNKEKSGYDSLVSTNIVNLEVNYHVLDVPEMYCSFYFLEDYEGDDGVSGADFIVLEVGESLEHHLLVSGGYI